VLEVGGCLSGSWWGGGVWCGFWGKVCTRVSEISNDLALYRLSWLVQSTNALVERKISTQTLVSTLT